MHGERGQASIFIAIIFQVLFIFFAMVVNVGLLVHDKINLQNSTDIAAYYAAMKQAEVLNAMAQVNYQIHQTWKLFNWRLWVLGDAGRNQDFPSAGVGSTGANGATDDNLATWAYGSNFPIVCVTNPVWQEVAVKGRNAENLCAKTHLNLKALVPPVMIGAQSVFAPVFQSFINAIAIQNNFFKGDFNNTGLANYKMAALFLSSYKLAAARRRFAIHHLQSLLLSSSGDFSDMTGQSVKTTTQTTLNNNLTASNKANGVDFQFQSGLNAQTPFMVPIEVRAFVPYLDFTNNTNAAVASVKQINQPSTQDTATPSLYQETKLFWDKDYNGGPTLETASAFSGESEVLATNQNSFDSLIGFEKNPWVLAYVRVTATTHPKMLFSPITGGSGIALTAESYAMPFGGKMGPWYYDSWPSGQDTSQAGNLTSATTFAAPRMDTPVTSTSLPNYSRYPGDKLGLSSHAARYTGLSQINGKTPSYTDYDFTIAYTLSNPQIDPVVAALPQVVPTPSLRGEEKAAIAPDLFDATYYSVTYDFSDRYKAAYTLPSGQSGMLTSLSCFDLGNDLPPLVNGQAILPLKISQIFYPNPGSVTPPFWILSKPEHLNTSWSQGDPGQYDDAQAKLSVGQTWSHPDDPALPPAGGRAGYSVKLVSKSFLQRSDLPLGGVGVVGKIANPPQ